MSLPLYVLLSAILINSFGYRHPANFHRWTEGYFSTPERIVSNQNAVAFVREEAGDAKIAVQNRILPHLADRAFCYRLGEWEKADWVVLSVGESAWPWNDQFPRQLARTLAGRADWKLVFAEEGTAVFARRSATELPEAQATPLLQL